MITTTQYAIQLPDDTVEKVGGPILQVQALAEYLAKGIPADPISREVTDWAVDVERKAKVTHDLAREAVISIGVRLWETEFQDGAVLIAALAELRGYADDLLNDDDVLAATEAGVNVNILCTRMEHLRRLVGEIDHRERIESGSYDKNLCAPDEDHQRLQEDAERRVEEAADALISKTALKQMERSR